MATSSTTTSDHAGSGSPGGRRTRRRTHPIERGATYAVIGLAALGALFADGRPTSLLIIDAVMRVAFAGVVTAAGSRSKRAPLLLMSGIAAVAADGTVLVTLAAAGLLLGLFAAAADRRGRLIGALIAGTAVNVLLRLPPGSVHGVSALLAAAASAPVLWSGYRNSPRKVRQRARTITYGVIAATGVFTMLFAAALVEARAHVERGIADAREGLADIRHGDQEAAIRRFDDASQAFNDAHSAAGAFWAMPSRLVPLLGQHLRAMDTVTSAGADLVDTAAFSASQADVKTLSFTAGAIDVDQVASFEEPLQAVVNALTTAQARIDAARSPWLLAPLQDRINGLSEDIDSALPQAVTALKAVQVAPEMLGADAPRHYFLAFITPAEQRGLGGFMGNFGVLTLDDGRMSLTRSGRTGEIRPKQGEPLPTLVGPDDYIARYGALQPNFYLQDIPLSPDFPSVAQVFEGIYPQVEGGEPVDGVIALDPYTLAALLRYTGPIKLEGLDEPLNSQNAADFLLRAQYVDFPQRADRIDFLDDATRIVFERLTNSNIPNPHDLADQLSPLVSDGRLMAHSIHPDEQDLFARIGLDNAYPPVDSGDFVGITTQNSGNNKIDIFLDRTLTYEATYDPSTGGVDATATVVLHNASPTTGLPDNVIGNTAGLPVGTNRTFLTVYSPLQADSWKIDGVATPFNALPELGRQAYASLVDIPPGATVTVEVHLSGGIGPSDTYKLTVGSQPTITNDQVHVVITPAGGAKFSSAEVFKIEGGKAESTFEQQTDVVLTANLRR